jgi:hypothetical protein
MPLPSTGSISMSQINLELFRPGSSTISLDAAENGSYGAINTCSASRPSSSNPASMSEWRGYNHEATCCPAAGTYYTQYCSGYDLYYTYHDGSCGYYSSLYQANSPTCGYSTPTCTTRYTAYAGYFSYYECGGDFYSGYYEQNYSVCAEATSGGGWIDSGFSCGGGGGPV